MANRNTQGFGLVPAGTLGSTPATSGQGKYKIDAGYATTIYQNGAVASSAGYIIDGQTTDAPILGVLNGIFYNAATTLKTDVFESLRSGNSKLRRYRCICIR